MPPKLEPVMGAQDTDTWLSIHDLTLSKLRQPLQGTDLMHNILILGSVQRLLAWGDGWIQGVKSKKQQGTHLKRAHLHVGPKQVVCIHVSIQDTCEVNIC